MSGAARKRLAVALLLLAAGARAQEEPPPPPPMQEPTPKPDEAPIEVTREEVPPPAAPSWFDDVHGSFALDYRLRFTNHDSDQDLYGILSADVGDPESAAIAGRVVARAAWDVDGNTDHNGAYAFDSLEDTYDSRLTAQLYEGWLGGKLDGPFSRWRGGRFFAEDIPLPTYVDGARIETAPATDTDLIFGVLGGVPTHLYESSPEGDLIFGGFVSDRPWTGAKARLDYLHIEDAAQFEDHKNGLTGLSLWQELGEQVDFFGQYLWLDGQARNLDARANWSDPELQMRAQLSYYELFQTQTSLSTDIDPYFESAFDYDPYRQTQLSVGKQFGDHFDLSGGFDVRRLRDSAQDTEFNHEFERYFLVPTLIGVPDEDTSISVTWELWDAGSERFDTYGGDVEHVFADGIKGRVGTSYSLYKYDFYQGRELDRVRTIYAGVDWRVDQRLRLRLNYAWERDEFDTYQTLRMQGSWTF